MANSSQLSLPRITAPAASRRATAVQSYGGIKLSRIFEPAVVRTPLVTMTSLIATGTPASGGKGLPSAAICVDAPGLRQRALLAKSQKRADLGVFFSDARVEILRQRGRGRVVLSRDSRCRTCHQSSIVLFAVIFSRALRFIHCYLSITFGTSKNVPSVSGAFFTATSCGSDFRRPSLTSSRMA